MGNRESLLKNIIEYINAISFKTTPYKIEHLKLDKQFRKQREAYIKLMDETLKLADSVELILKSQGYKLTANKKIAHNDILTDIKIRRDQLFYNFSSYLRSKSNDINCINPSALDIPSLNKKLIYEKIS